MAESAIASDVLHRAGWAVSPGSSPSSGASLPLSAVRDEAGPGAGGNGPVDDDFDVRLHWPNNEDATATSALRPSFRRDPSSSAPEPDIRAPERVALPDGVSARGAVTRVADEIRALHEAVLSGQTQLAALDAATRATRTALTDQLGALAARLDERAIREVATPGDVDGAIRLLRDEVSASLADLRQTIETRSDAPADEPVIEVDIEPLIDAVRGELTASVSGLPERFGADVASSLDDVHARLTAELAASEERTRAVVADEIQAAIGGIRDEFGRAVTTSLTEAAARLADDVVAAVDEARLAFNAELEALRVELTQLKRRIPVRAQSASGAGSDDADELVRKTGGELRHRLDDDDIERVAAAVTRQLSDAFDIVYEPEPAPSPQPRAASTARQRTRSR